MSDVEHSKPRDPISDLTMQDLYARLSLGWTETAFDPETWEKIDREAGALLPELREAVFGGMEHTGGSGGFGARMPISDGALDLYEAIDQEISESWAHLHPGQIPNADTPERLLSQVVALAQPGTVVSITTSVQRVDHQGTSDEHWWVERVAREFEIVTLMRRWVRQIIEFFNPIRTREIQAPCVQCGEEWAWKTTAGEHHPYRVFVFVQDDHGNTLEARCLTCGLSWGPAKFAALAAALGATNPNEEGETQ